MTSAGRRRERDVTRTWAGARETTTQARNGSEEANSPLQRRRARIDRFPRARYDLELHYQAAPIPVNRLLQRLYGHYADYLLQPVHYFYCFRGPRENVKILQRYLVTGSGHPLVCRRRLFLVYLVAADMWRMANVTKVPASVNLAAAAGAGSGCKQSVRSYFATLPPLLPVL